MGCCKNEAIDSTKLTLISNSNHILKMLDNFKSYLSLQLQRNNLIYVIESHFY